MYLISWGWEGFQKLIIMYPLGEPLSKAWLRFVIWSFWYLFLFLLYFILWFLSTDCQVKTSVEWVPHYYFDSLFLAWGFDTLFNVGEGKRPYTSWLNSISATPSPCACHYCLSFLLWAISVFLTLLIYLFRATRRYFTILVEVLYCLAAICMQIVFSLFLNYDW